VPTLAARALATVVMTEAIADPGPVWTDDVIRHHAAALYRSAFAMTRNAADAEDLVQEAFARALAASGRFEPGTNLGGWLYRIMFHAFVDGYHRRRREPQLAADPASRVTDLRWSPGSTDGRSAEEHVMRNLVQAEILAAIRALPSRYRLMVYLADVLGLGYRQIADLTGISVGTVKSSLHRGRGQLRTRLAAQRVSVDDKLD
jgi:RNA polymerase sigma-70 factor, ECF subfamily